MSVSVAVCDDDRGVLGGRHEGERGRVDSTADEGLFLSRGSNPSPA